jgi:hypothetical protein
MASIKGGEASLIGEAFWEEAFGDLQPEVLG